MQAFELSADNKLDGLSPLYYTGQGVHGFQEEFQILIHLTTELSSILSQLWCREDGGISGLCSHLASFLL